MTAPDDRCRADVLADCIATFRRWLHLPDPGHLQLMLAAIAANRTTGDPVWVLFVGPPGSGKTEALGPLATLPDCHPAATLTEASLLSGTPKKEAGGAKGGLLREIGDHGIIVLKDFTSILSMNRDSRAAVLAALREIYDGAWTRHVGTDGGRTLHWSGKIGLIAGCTGTIDSHHSVMASMGERMVLYRLAEVDGEQQIAAALERGDDEKTMRDELAAAVRAVVELAHVAPGALDDDERQRLTALARFAARARSAVERDGQTRDIVLIPTPEAPARIALVLRRLLDGMTSIGVDRANAWQLIGKVALDCLPDVRRKVLEAVIGAGAPITTKAVAETLGYPTTTARRNLEDLAAHGIVNRQAAGGADVFQVSAWTVEQWERARLDGKTWPRSAAIPEKSVPANRFPAPFSLPFRSESDISGTADDWRCVECLQSLDPEDTPPGAVSASYWHPTCGLIAS